MRKIYLLSALFLFPLLCLGQEKIDTAAVVTADRQALTIASGVIEYDVALDPMSEYKSLSDIVSSLPLVSYEIKDQKLSVDGSSNVCIILNGKKSLVLNVNNYAYMAEILRGRQISSIRIDTHPDGLYSGYSAVIDIRTRDSLSDFYGLNVSADASSRFSAAPSAGFTGRVGRLAANASYRYDWADSRPEVTGTCGYDVTCRKIYESSDTTDMQYSRAHAPELTLSYDLSRNDVLFLGGKGTFRNSSTLVESSDVINGAASWLDSRNDVRSDAVEANVEYQHTFKSENQRMFTLQYTLTRSELENCYFAGSDCNGTLDRQHAFSADYLHTISPALQLNATAALFSRRYNSISRSETLLEHSQNVADLKVEGTLRRGKLFMNGSMGYEHAYDDVMGSHTSAFSDDYGTLNARLRTTYFIRTGHSLMMLLSRDAYRPDINMRNPYVNETVSGVVSQGNPGLSCQNNYQFLMSYRYMKGMKLSSSTMFSCFYTPDGIYSSSSLMDDGRIMNTFSNGFRSTKFYLSESVMWNPTKKISINAIYRLAWYSYAAASGGSTSFLDHFANFFARWEPWNGGSLSANLTVSNPYSGLSDATQAVRMHYSLKGSISFYQSIGDRLSIGIYVNEPWTRNVREVFDYMAGDLNVLSTRFSPGMVAGASLRLNLGHFDGMPKRNSRHVTDSDRSRN